ncbi:MAG: hypothetical protein CM15mP111_0390 [Hyphomicrobiales bacterium]|nr:MAG: hypothetical protein CM15mP111_0390 [Hyphomicrobiales bacterium]
MSWINNKAPQKKGRSLNPKKFSRQSWVKAQKADKWYFPKGFGKKSKGVFPGSNYHMKIPAKKTGATLRAN